MGKTGMRVGIIGKYIGSILLSWVGNMLCVRSIEVCEHIVICY